MPLCLRAAAQAASKGGADWGARFDAMLRQRKLDLGGMDVETLENKVYSKVLQCRRLITPELRAAAPAVTPCTWCLHSCAVVVPAGGEVGPRQS